MRKSKKRLLVIDALAIAFIAAQIVLFPLIQFTPGDVSSICSYISIVLAALFALCSASKEKIKYFIRLGLCFTLVADYFLVLNDKLLEGVVAFIFVQAAYCAYLFAREEHRHIRRANLISRAILSAVLVVAAFVVLGDDTDALAITSVIYYGNLVVNTVFAFLLGKRDRVFAIGLALFCMCDLCIGLEVLFSSYLNSDALDFFYGAYLSLPWIFYQPSQTLISLSLYHRKYKKMQGDDSFDA